MVDIMENEKRMMTITELTFKMLWGGVTMILMMSWTENLMHIGTLTKIVEAKIFHTHEQRFRRYDVILQSE